MSSAPAYVVFSDLVGYMSSFVYQCLKAVYIVMLYNQIWYILKEASCGYLVEKCAVRDQHLAWLTTYSARQGTGAKLLFLDQ